jgi:HNH endonuclease
VYVTEDLLVMKVRHVGDCWIWKAASNRDGYGRFWFRGKLWLAHRASYTLFVADIPDGLVLDHLCRNQLCVNPKHLEPVTQKVNHNRGDKSKPMNKTRCINGHSFENNMYVRKNGTYDCIMCRRASQKRSRTLSVK